MAIEFVVAMKDEVTGAASRALSSLLGLESKAKSLTGGMAGVLDPFKGSALSAGDQIKTLQSTLTGLEKTRVKQIALGMDPEKIAATEGKIGSLKNALAGLAPQAEGAAGGMEGLAAGIGEAAGPIGAAIAAYVALGTVLVSLTLKGAEMALEFSEMREKSIVAFDALGKGAGAGKATLAMIEELAQKLPQTRGELKEWAKTLMAAGITDMSKLKRGLEAVASAQALLGDEAAGKVTNLLAKISEAQQMGTKLKINEKMFQGLGVSAEDVAAKLGIPAAKLKAMMKTGEIDAKKFGDALEDALIEKGKGPLEVMSGSLSSMKAKFLENINAMFSGVDVKPFTSGLKSIGELFSSTSASGKQMKASITTIFNALFAAAAASLPFIKWAIQGIITVAVTLVKIAKPIGSAFAWAYHALGGTKTLTTALKGLAVVVGLVAVVLAVATAPVWLIVAAFGVVVGIVGAVVAGISMLIGALINLAVEAASALASFAGAAADAAGNFISGLVGGISSGAGAVVDAMKNLASSAVGAFKTAMGISSPSKVMMQMGHHSTAGLSQGVERGETAVQKAGAGLSDALQAGVNAPGTAPGSDAGGGAPAAPGGAPGGKAKGGAAITVEAGAIVIHGAGGDVMALTEDALSRLLERIALSQGLGAT